jgi:hypothetical protein
MLPAELFVLGKTMKLLRVVALLLCGIVFAGCQGTQARLMHNKEADKVGSNRAGAEVYNPIVRESVGKLLGRAAVEPIQQVGYQSGPNFPSMKRKVCFISLENKSVEELGDFKEHIKSAILEGISSSDQFEVVSDRAVTAGLRQLSLRPDDLFAQENMRMFTSTMGQGGTPVDYLLFATITSGTTESNKDMQRDYKLSLELINTQTFVPIIESTPMRKEYNNSIKGKFENWFKK